MTKKSVDKSAARRTWKMMELLMYGTIPSEKMPSFEMLPPVSVSTYPRTRPRPRAVSRASRGPRR